MHPMQVSNAASDGLADNAGENRLLAALPTATYARLRSHLELVRLGAKHILYEPDRPIDHVFFPISGVVSLFTSVAVEGPLEVATVGNEGMVAPAVFLGAFAVPGQAVEQIAGTAWRVEAAAFRALCRRDEPLRELLQRYVQAYIDHLSWSMCCARTHSPEQRCARALLHTDDRVPSDQFQLTQESLASMLGVRRPTASGVMASFRRAGFVRYTRGRVTVVGRAGLEAAACECYGLVKNRYDRLTVPAPAAP